MGAIRENMFFLPEHRIGIVILTNLRFKMAPSVSATDNGFPVQGLHSEKLP